MPRPRGVGLPAVVPLRGSPAAEIRHPRRCTPSGALGLVACTATRCAHCVRTALSGPVLVGVSALVCPPPLLRLPAAGRLTQQRSSALGPATACAAPWRHAAHSYEQEDDWEDSDRYGKYKPDLDKYSDDLSPPRSSARASRNDLGDNFADADTRGESFDRAA